MNYNPELKEWLTDLRFSRKVCMLIPMEACMGHPVVIRSGEEFILPFFGVASVEKTHTLCPPFAYLRVCYPSAAILTYNNLRTLPEWKDIDWKAVAEKNENLGAMLKFEDYYKAICSQETPPQMIVQQDELLMNSICALASNPTESPLVVWYQKLIGEAQKYR